MELRELIRIIVCSIVDDEENIEIEEFIENEVLNFVISVSGPDVGKVIGTKGRIASAIRIVAKAAAAKQGTRILISVDKDPLS